jgi:hypothetical protein
VNSTGPAIPARPATLPSFMPFILNATARDPPTRARGPRPEDLRPNGVHRY